MTEYEHDYLAPANAADRPYEGRTFDQARAEIAARDTSDFEAKAAAIHEKLDELQRIAPDDEDVLDIIHRAKWLVHDLAFPA